MVEHWEGYVIIYDESYIYIHFDSLESFFKGEGDEDNKVA